MPETARLSAAFADRYRIERFVVEIKTAAALQYPQVSSPPSI